VVAGLGVGEFCVSDVSDAAVTHGEDFEAQNTSTHEAHFFGTYHMFGKEIYEDGMGDDNDDTFLWHFL
jgi:hypothetical protein